MCKLHPYTSDFTCSYIISECKFCKRIMQRIHCNKFFSWILLKSVIRSYDYIKIPRGRNIQNKVKYFA